MRFFVTVVLGGALVAACAYEPPPVARDYTVYTGTLPSTSGGSERTARVTLRDDGGAAVQVSSWGPGSDFFAVGKWQQTDGGIVIELTSAPGGRLVFRRSGDLMLGRQWDRALWGDREPVLQRVY
ncbi:MAG TPA: hypothetical protein VFJ70_19685 [Burkholderiales bacterium]|nr:hypothetical protein [Burkholderiales bacterium]